MKVEDGEETRSTIKGRAWHGCKRRKKGEI